MNYITNDHNLNEEMNFRYSHIKLNGLHERCMNFSLRNLLLFIGKRRDLISISENIFREDG
jgi:hypothetical protein